MFNSLKNIDKRLLIVGTLVVLIIGSLAWVGRHNASKLNNNDGKGIKTIVDKGLYNDPNSRETVSNPEGKTPENYGATTDAPIYLGFSSLLDIGVSSDQLGDYKFAVYQFLKSNNQKADEVSIAVDTVVPVPHDRDSASTVDSVNFNIVVDRKTTYKVKMDYFDLSSIDLRIYDATGANQVYDSGTVSNQNIY